MRRIAIVAASMLVAAGAGFPGCTRAIKEGLGAYRGAKGIAVVIRPIRTSLTEYDTFELKPFADKTGSGVPVHLDRKLARYFNRMMAEEGIPRRGLGDRTLTIEGTYLYYEPEETSLAEAASPLEEVVARVQLRDGRRLIAEANCVGRSTTSVNSGFDSKAEGLAKAIVGWIRDVYPEEDDDAEAEKKPARPNKVRQDAKRRIAAGDGENPVRCQYGD